MKRFKLDNLIDSILSHSPKHQTDIISWQGHIPFAFLLIRELEPDVFVELGTHKGDSYLAFCQAVQQYKYNTKCYAIDTWKGDKQSGFYGEEVYEELKTIHDLNYGKFSSLVRSTFSNALNRFENESIDILHIDGLHSYEASKNNFSTWLPKMSKRGVVLLHDIAEMHDDFGVYRLWDELSNCYPSFSFPHSHGLGILAVGTNIPSYIEILMELNNSTKNRIQKLFQIAGNAVTLKGVYKTIEHERASNKKLNNELDQIILDLKEDIQIIKRKHDRTKNELDMQVNDNREIKKFLNELKKSNSDKDVSIRSKDRILTEMEKVLSQKEIIISKKDLLISEKDYNILKKDEVINAKDILIANKDKKINESSNFLQRLEQKLFDNTKKMEEYSEKLSLAKLDLLEKKKEIEAKNKLIDSFNNQEKNYRSQIDHLNFQNIEYAKIIHKLKSSYSWKITFPIRFVRKFFTRLSNSNLSVPFKFIYWFLTLQLLRGFRDRRYFKFLKNSQAFDVNFYRNTYKDVELSGNDPIWHYIRNGEKEGRYPTPWFDPKFYLSKYPDVRESHIQPFYHFLLYGRYEGRSTSL
jgi:hypothetical protein